MYIALQQGQKILSNEILLNFPKTFQRVYELQDKNQFLARLDEVQEELLYYRRGRRWH